VSILFFKIESLKIGFTEEVSISAWALTVTIKQKRKI
jgi:hypothetical protein